MAAYSWPATLPQTPRPDFQTVRGVNIISTPMDSGPAKRRRRSAGIEQMTCGFVMTTAQVATLENFITNTIKGTARFDFAHPITAVTVEVRVVPQGDGQLYSAAYLGPSTYAVSMTLEVLP